MRGAFGYLVVITLAAGAAATEPIRRLAPFRGPTAIAFSLDGRSLFIGDETGQITQWDINSGERVAAVRERGAAVRDLQLAPNGKSIAVVETQTIRLLSTETGRETWSRGEQAPTDAAFSPDGKRLAVRAAAGLVMLDAAEGKEVWRAADVGIDVSRPSFLPNGDVLLDGVTEQGVSNVFAFAANGIRSKMLLAYQARRGVKLLLRDLTVSADGQLLASAHGDHCVRIWDRLTGREAKTFILPRDSGGATCTVFSPDGRLLLAGSGDGTLRGWEIIKAHRPFARIPDAMLTEQVLEGSGPKGSIRRIRVAADGQLIATAGDGDVRVWRPRPEPWPRVETESTAYYWGDLGAESGPWGFRAVMVMATHPAEAVALIRDRRPPMSPVPVAKLIADLESDQFATREAATRRLIERGSEVAESLLRVERGELPAESRKRLTHILANLRSLPRSEDLRNRRIVHVLEKCATPEAKALLEEYARGTPDTVLTEEARAALGRMSMRR